jgi:hypothetical protein
MVGHQVRRALKDAPTVTTRETERIVRKLALRVASSDFNSAIVLCVVCLFIRTVRSLPQGVPQQSHSLGWVAIC